MENREQLGRALDSYQARLQALQGILPEASSLILVPCARLGDILLGRLGESRLSEHTACVPTA